MSIELAEYAFRPACTPVCHMASVTRVPLRTHLRVPSNPVQYICELPVSQPLPSGNLTTMQLQPHLSERKTQKSLLVPPAWCAPVFISLHLGAAAWHCMPVNLSSHEMDCTQNQDAATAATGDLNHNPNISLVQLFIMTPNLYYNPLEASIMAYKKVLKEAKMLWIK